MLVRIVVFAMRVQFRRCWSRVLQESICFRRFERKRQIIAPTRVAMSVAGSVIVFGGRMSAIQVVDVIGGQHLAEFERTL